RTRGEHSRRLRFLDGAALEGLEERIVLAADFHDTLETAIPLGDLTGQTKSTPGALTNHDPGDPYSFSPTLDQFVKIDLDEPSSGLGQHFIVELYGLGKDAAGNPVAFSIAEGDIPEYREVRG